MSITVTLAQIRRIAERADIEEADGGFVIEIDMPSKGDPGDWRDPVRVVREGGGAEIAAREEAFRFAVDADGTLLEPGP